VHWQEFGFALLRAGMPRDALEVFERAIASNLSDPLILAGVTLAFRALGDERYEKLVDFPKYVRVYDLHGEDGAEGVSRFNQTLAAELDALHLAKAEPIDQTIRGGTQTTERLFDERSPAIRQLKTRFDSALSHYIGNLPDESWHPMSAPKSLRIGYTGSWSCRLAPGGYHHNHVHPLGWISSVYYARLPKPSTDPESREGWLKFGESNYALGPWDHPNQLVKPVVGRLVLFPSFFWHGTIPFSDDGDRLTVAFDVAPEKDSAGVGN
jgi:Putative 2OG-Fe(II) oxygenase